MAGRTGYAQLSNGLWLNDKANDLLETNPHAFGMWVMSLSYASDNLTDGMLNHRALRRLGCDQTTVDVLVACGMWEMDDDGIIRIHDYLRHNTSREQIESSRDVAASRQRRKRERDVTHDVTPLVTHDVTHDVTRDVPRDIHRDVPRDVTPPVTRDLNQNQNQNINPPLTPPTEGSDGLFEQAWAIYPKHTGSKQQAKTLFDAIPDKSQVVEAAKEINRRVQSGEIEQRYVPNMVRWLDNRTYLDYQPRKPETLLPSDQWVDTHVYARLPDGSDQFTVKRRLWKLIRDGTSWEDAANTIINECEKEKP